MVLGGAEALARVPLFAGLPVRELERLGQCMHARRYARGEAIFLEGDPGTGLCVIESGLVKIMLTGPDGRERVLNVYGPGEFFGEFSLLDGEPRSADAVAQVNCRVYWLLRDDFLAFVQSHPRAATTLLAELSRRLRHTTELVHDDAFRDVPTRLARIIERLAAARGRRSQTGLAIEARLTQTDLAAMIGATRETVNRYMRAYQREGLIRFEHGVITVLDVERLAHRAHDE